MASVWLTYAWSDNAAGDIDYYAQELVATGLDVRLDRWNLRAGARLWDQIAEFITDPSQSDGWLLIATQASLGSEACKEEFAYALDRALHTRGADFPVIALFTSRVERDLIPPGIRTRLHVSTADPDWKERVAAAVERRPLNVGRATIEPYLITIHPLPVATSPRRFAIELRPRAGGWYPAIVAFPLAEKEHVDPVLRSGPPNRVPRGGIEMGSEGACDDDQFWCMRLDIEVSPTRSCYLFCAAIPSRFTFGTSGGEPQYQATYATPAQA